MRGGGRGSGGQVVGEVVVKCGGRVFVETALWWEFSGRKCSEPLLQKCAVARARGMQRLCFWIKNVVGFWLSRFRRFHWFRLVICLIFELQHNEIDKGVPIVENAIRSPKFVS